MDRTMKAGATSSLVLSFQNNALPTGNVLDLVFSDGTTLHLVI